MTAVPSLLGRLWRRADLRRSSASYLVLVIVALTCLLVLPGPNRPVSDTESRLEVSHWLWTGESPVIKGILYNGVRHPWYGVGQSLVMLPADVAVTKAIEAASPEIGVERERWLRFVAVSYLVFPILNALAALMGFQLLRTLGFSAEQSLAGVITLLFGSTFLWHCQNNQENNLQLLCDLIALTAATIWLADAKRRWLAVAFSALGFNLLIRLTALADVVWLFGFIFFAAWLGAPGEWKTRLWVAMRRALSAAAVGLPVVGGFLLLDRLYHWYRFGSFWGTYTRLIADQLRAQNVELPPNFPFGNDMVDGILGPLISPGKSVFIYDPLLVVFAVVAIVFWKRFPARLGAVVASLPLFLAMLIVGYSRYSWWSDDATWGNRFVVAPVHLAALLVVPIVMRFRSSDERWPLRLAGAFLCVSLVLQLSSLVFPSYFERDQVRPIDTPSNVATELAGPGQVLQAGRRLRNIAAVATGNFDEWGLNVTGTGTQIGEPNPMLVPLLPLNTLPPSVAWSIKALWLAGFALLLLLLASSYRTIGRDRQDKQDYL